MKNNTNQLSNVFMRLFTSSSSGLPPLVVKTSNIEISFPKTDVSIHRKNIAEYRKTWLELSVSAKSSIALTQNIPIFTFPPDTTSVSYAKQRK